MSSNPIRIVCVYTEQYKESVDIAKRCVESGKKFDYDVELYPAVYWKDLDAVHKKYNIKRKYKDSFNTKVNSKNHCPATRTANGTTHYLLYKWCVEHQEPICIVEHDSVFVGYIPKAIENGVIQISSHVKEQIGKERMLKCNRARKMRKFQPTFKQPKWKIINGITKHPLSGINGTSGYIITPSAAKKMIDYVERDGVAGADRIRTEFIGEGNLYFQVPQSVICHHDVKSAVLAKKGK